MLGGQIHCTTTIPKTTSCEIQIRALLQHAHAELTHDKIYKAKKSVKPDVHRTVAKSMALIETTDDFFTEVTQKLNNGPLQELGILDQLDGLYFTMTEMKSHNQKSALFIWEEFEDLFNDQLITNIQDFITQNSYLVNKIKGRYLVNAFYKQSTVLFVYWLLKKKKQRLMRDWPLPGSTLALLASDLGISLDGD